MIKNDLDALEQTLTSIKAPFDFKIKRIDVLLTNAQYQTLKCSGCYQIEWISIAASPVSLMSQEKKILVARYGVYDLYLNFNITVSF